MYVLTAHIAAFHEKAEHRLDRGGAAALTEVSETNIRVCAIAALPALPRHRSIASRAASTANWLAMAGCSTSAGRRARCGAATATCICAISVASTDGLLLFDCVEFSEDLASIDVLYDLAFLLMDLDHRGHQGLANLVLNRDLDLTEEDDGLALMPLFLALRAVICAHVTATMAEHGWAQAIALPPSPKRGVISTRPRRRSCRGRRGWSRSAASAAAANRLSPPRLPPSSDDSPARASCAAMSCASCALAPSRRRPLPPDAYTAEVNALVYRDLCARATGALRAGYSAVIDAVALREAERNSFAAVGRRRACRLPGCGSRRRRRRCWRASACAAAMPPMPRARCSRSSCRTIPAPSIGLASTPAALPARRWRQRAGR